MCNILIFRSAVDGNRSFNVAVCRQRPNAVFWFVEASYETEIGGTPFSLAVGGVFGDDNGYYFTDGSGLINITMGISKEIKFSESFSLPVNAAITLNPDSEDIFLTFGFSL